MARRYRRRVGKACEIGNLEMHGVMSSGIESRIDFFHDRTTQTICGRTPDASER